MDMPTLRPLEDADIPLLRDWLYRDHVAKWFEHPENWLREVRGRHTEFSFIRHFTVLCGQRPIGFCQYYDGYDAQEDWYAVDRPGDTFSIDYLIGEAAYLNKGYGKAIVAMLTEKVAQEAGARRIIVQPEPGNAPSHGVLRANGYVCSDEQGYYQKFLRPVDGLRHGRGGRA